MSTLNPTQTDQINIIIQSREQQSGRELLSVAAVDQNGKALSTGVFTLIDSAFGTATVKALLAGGIATPVQNRRGGNIRKMFDFMHAQAVEEGAAVAILHPFSFSYYNKFGYEKVADHLMMRFPTRMLDFVPRRCAFVPYEAAHLADMLAIYRQFAAGRHLLLMRADDRHYAGKETYIFYDNGTPTAYIVFSTEKPVFINNYRDTLLTVHEMAYVSPAGLWELLSFLRMFEGEFDEIQLLDGSIYYELELLLRHYTHTRYTRLPDLAARVLHTEKLLCANAYPQRAGAFTIKVLDTMPTVAGVYHVAYGDGTCTVTQLDDTQAADVTMPAHVFARLVYGNDPLDANSLRFLQGVTVDGDTEDLLRAFPKRPCGIFEHF